MIVGKEFLWINSSSSCNDSDTDIEFSAFGEVWRFLFLGFVVLLKVS